MTELANKVALVTGGARGIGEATVRLLHARGAKVVFTDVLADEGNAVAASIGYGVEFMKHDVRNLDQWAAAVALAESKFGKLDILVNNAGIGGAHFERLETVSLDVVRPMLDVNIVGTLLGIQAAVPAMRRSGSGSIINLSSAQGMMSANALSVYSATKWAVRGLTKSAALELGPKIRVNSIHPGGADTKMGNIMGLSLEEYSENMKNTPLRRACDTSEIAEGIVFFASDRSRFCTGAELAMDGGLTAGIYYAGLPGHYSEDAG